MENSHFIHRVHNAGNYVLGTDYESGDNNAMYVKIGDIVFTEENLEVNVDYPVYKV